jgi:hypothetical protein
MLILLGYTEYVSCAIVARHGPREKLIVRYNKGKMD